MPFHDQIDSDLGHEIKFWRPCAMNLLCDNTKCRRDVAVQMSHPAFGCVDRLEGPSEQIKGPEYLPFQVLD